jgi:serine phosphatase RsbU (regulator of sigma subunit)
MNSFRIDFPDIAIALFISSVGLVAVVISLFRLRNKDFSILNFGLFCTLYGFRWLIETPSIQSISGFTSINPYFFTLLTYLTVIPFAAFFVNIFGRGIFNSLLWVFRSYIIYLIIAIIYDLFSTPSVSSKGINPIFVIIWCVVLLINIFFTKRESHIELLIMRIVLLICVVAVINDNLVNLHLLPWAILITNPCILVLCIGLGFVAIHHFFSNERKLLAIEQEIEIARQIQNSNIPSDIHPPCGIAIAARYVPMSTVAGDFYDILIKKNEGTGILIADVCGHGIGASLIGSMLKIAFASQSDNLADPARVLTEINRILQGKIENSFVTAGYFFIHSGNRKLSYSLAGHPPQVLLRKANKEVISLLNGGTILGPFPDAVYENAELEIGKDDRLILYTDGILETKNSAGIYFEDERMISFFKEHSGQSAEQTSDQFLNYLSTWTGKSKTISYDDDLTLIIIDITA